MVSRLRRYDALSSRHWSALPSRVVPTTRRLLELSTRPVSRHVFRRWVDRRAVSGAGWRNSCRWARGRFAQLSGIAVSTSSHRTSSRTISRLRFSVLEAAGAPRPLAYRAPEWSINEGADWAFDELARQRFDVDASRAPLKIVGRVTYPRYPHVLATRAGDLVEVPPFVADRFGQVMPLGWGWGLRMSSPRSVLASMALANDRGTPAVLTVHPWELDPDPPRVRLRPRSTFRPLLPAERVRGASQENRERSAFFNTFGHSEMRTGNLTVRSLVALAPRLFRLRGRSERAGPSARLPRIFVEDSAAIARRCD